jgi:hypothetical protein
MRIILPSILLSTLLISALSVLPVQTASAQEQVAPGVWLSRNGNFRLSYSSEINPIPMGRAHEWVIFILDSNRRPIEDAEIEIHGYHPETREILPRMTYISTHMGRGAYQVINMYFHQRGEWQLNVVISSGSKVDAVLIPLSI